jgi:hypothetical protein
LGGAVGCGGECPPGQGGCRAGWLAGGVSSGEGKNQNLVCTPSPPLGAQLDAPRFVAHVEQETRATLARALRGAIACAGQKVKRFGVGVLGGGGRVGRGAHRGDGRLGGRAMGFAVGTAMGTAWVRDRGVMDFN